MGNIKRSGLSAGGSELLQHRRHIVLQIEGMARTSHTGGIVDLSESLDNLGLDSMEVVALIFDIEEKFNIQIPINANMDIESKTLADLIHAAFWGK